MSEKTVLNSPKMNEKQSQQPILEYFNVQYKTGNLTEEEKEQCVLDIRVPKTGTKWPVVVYFHGGGMIEGDKDEGWVDANNDNWGINFLNEGILMVMPNYRLISKGGHWPNYIQDAAAALVWVRKNIENYNGDPNSIFISGFSAGAYLTHMLSLDTSYLNSLNISQSQFAGFIALSGQTRSHSNIHSDVGEEFSLLKHMALGYVRQTTVPYQIIVGGNEGQTVIDNKKLYEELIQAGSTDVYFDIIQGESHSNSDMNNEKSIKRDIIIAFVNKYKLGN